MTATVIVRAFVPAGVKRTAKAVDGKMGLTLSDIVRLTLTRVARDRILPFDVKVPNAATRAAMKESRTLMAMGATRRNRVELLDKLDEKATKPKKSRAAARGRLDKR